MKWLVIGISGVTCGGKTTLANECSKILPNINLISQDDYFFPQDSPNHVFIPELNHFNWEILSSLDMDKMYSDIKALINTEYINIESTEVFKKVAMNGIKNNKEVLENVDIIRRKLDQKNINVLLIEGFSIYNYEPIEKLCHFKFYLTLPRNVCFERRSKRVYDPPDVPGYFDECVWPEHMRQLAEIQVNCKNIVYLTEEDTDKQIIVLKHLLNFCKSL